MSFALDVMASDNFVVFEDLVSHINRFLGAALNHHFKSVPWSGASRAGALSVLGHRCALYRERGLSFTR
jgi:hypothetical protein